ncbi:MAG: hypothetical protein ABSD88_14495 [Candidatus Korobacteraceae bacterium]|jgi:hypothetical protein
MSGVGQQSIAEADQALKERAFRKVIVRYLPIMTLAYIVAFIDPKTAHLVFVLL